MRNLLIIIGLLITVCASSQSVIRESSATTKYGRTADTLNLNDAVSDSYYISPFSTDAELFWNIDSVAGTPSVTLAFEGSYNNSDWITINSTTLTPAVGDTTFVQSSGTYLYPYLKATATAVSNVQTIRYQYVLVVKNK